VRRDPPRAAIQKTHPTGGVKLDDRSFSLNTPTDCSFVRQLSHPPSHQVVASFLVI
jgi:hypothetical protein